MSNASFGRANSGNAKRTCHVHVILDNSPSARSFSGTILRRLGALVDMLRTTSEKSCSAFRISVALLHGGWLRENVDAAEFTVPSGNELEFPPGTPLVVRSQEVVDALTACVSERIAAGERCSGSIVWITAGEPTDTDNSARLEKLKASVSFLLAEKSEPDALRCSCWAMINAPEERTFFQEIGLPDSCIFVGPTDLF